VEGRQLEIGRSGKQGQDGQDGQDGKNAHLSRSSSNLIERSPSGELTFVVEVGKIGNGPAWHGDDLP
jgi:hypothetical protein